MISVHKMDSTEPSWVLYLRMGIGVVSAVALMFAAHFFLEGSMVLAKSLYYPALPFLAYVFYKEADIAKQPIERSACYTVAVLIFIGFLATSMWDLLQINGILG